MDIQHISMSYCFRYSQNHGVNLSRSKLRSTMPTSFSSYAVPSLNEVTSSMSTSKSLDINVVKNQEELPLQGGDRCCDKYISSICAKKVSTRNQPVGYATSDQLNRIERHSSDHITTCSSTPNHNSNSFVKISHHHTPITTSLICSSSPSSTIYTNEPLVHRNSHPDQRYSSYCQGKPSTFFCLCTSFMGLFCSILSLYIISSTFSHV
ncbi:unnamed protein product [Schistosoma mattheei]|uniref:Uncharacterized protein n=1 Tax=Schistosoma mattheei TaxID=31246 RepID=A0A183PPU6_9TREM|nr:unnamed protein product [Schistosoma mattheei]